MWSVAYNFSLADGDCWRTNVSDGAVVKSARLPPMWPGFDYRVQRQERQELSNYTCGNSGEWKGEREER